MTQKTLVMKPGGLKDVKTLEQEKKNLQSQLLGVKKKSQKLEKILLEKKKSKNIANNNNNEKNNNVHNRREENDDILNSTKVLGGQKTLHDLLPVVRRNKVTIKEKKIRDINSVDPQVIPFESDLKRIHLQHMKRTVCKVEIGKKTKTKEEERQEKASKQLKKEKMRAMASVSNVPKSMFPNRYIRGELPCTIEHGTKGLYLSWVCPLENLDYDYYLPIFFDGLQCTEEPIVFIARQGIEDMLYSCQGDASRVIPSLKHLVRPLRNALSKFDVTVLLNVLRALRQLVQCADGVGKAMTPYYKQFLQPMNAFLDRNKNLGDSIDYGQRKNDDVGEEVRLTLEMMERTGTEDAFKFIKFAIPPYQSYKEGL